MAVFVLNQFPVLEALILAAALSIDALIASFAYGSQKIKVPLGSVLLISLICSGMLGFTLLLGAQAAAFISEGLATGISFAILFGLGLLRVCDSSLKNWIQRNELLKGEIKFSLFHFKFILKVYADPKWADVDGSRTLSLKEAAALSVALSLDSIAAGLGVGLSGAGALLSLGLLFLLTVAAIGTGCGLGGKFANKLDTDISWVSGSLLILLAVLQL